MVVLNDIVVSVADPHPVPVTGADVADDHVVAAVVDVDAVLGVADLIIQNGVVATGNGDAVEGINDSVVCNEIMTAIEGDAIAVVRLNKNPAVFDRTVL